MRPGVAALALVALSGAAHVTSAQSPSDKSGATTASTCRVDSTADWFRKQRAWFDDSGHRWSNDTLRAMLLEAAGLDGVARGPLAMGWLIAGRDSMIGPRDSAMIEQLKRAGRGNWPVKNVVGAAGAHAAYLLALRDSSLSRRALHPFMEAGPEESPPPDVATLEDRNRLLAGRKQIYGTHFRLDSAGMVVLLPMEDSTHADLRRAGALLPPFKASACLARAARHRSTP
jgi:hypothetical protein